MIVNKKNGNNKPIMISTGLVIHKHKKGPATSINLIGERHSGTNWITNHLVDCVSREKPSRHTYSFDNNPLILVYKTSNLYVLCAHAVNL